MLVMRVPPASVEESPRVVVPEGCRGGVESRISEPNRAPGGRVRQRSLVGSLTPFPRWHSYPPGSPSPLCTDHTAINKSHTHQRFVQRIIITCNSTDSHLHGLSLMQHDIMQSTFASKWAAHQARGFRESRINRSPDEHLIVFRPDD